MERDLIVEQKHIDCDWLIEKSKGVYSCCDTRGVLQGSDLSRKEVMQKACPFFHKKRTKERSINNRYSYFS